MKPAGVIFDFDGVVVDSLSVHLTAWRHAYETLYSQELVDVEGLPGRSTGAISTILSERAGRPETKERLAQEKREFLKKSQDSIKPFPGALEAFEWLSSNSVPFGIASNAPHAFIEQTMLSLSVKVDYIFGVDDVPRPKPYPDVFLLCARSCGISFLDHHRTIVFEDSLHGLRAAVTAGMFPIGVATQHSRKELMKAGAKLVCQDIAEAIESGWFENLGTLQ